MGRRPRRTGLAPKRRNRRRRRLGPAARRPHLLWSWRWWAGSCCPRSTGQHHHLARAPVGGNRRDVGTVVVATPCALAVLCGAPAGCGATRPRPCGVARCPGLLPLPKCAPRLPASWTPTSRRAAAAPSARSRSTSEVPLDPSSCSGLGDLVLELELELAAQRWSTRRRKTSRHASACAARPHAVSSRPRLKLKSHLCPSLQRGPRASTQVRTSVVWAGPMPRSDPGSRGSTVRGVPSWSVPADVLAGVVGCGAGAGHAFEASNSTAEMQGAGRPAAVSRAQQRLHRRPLARFGAPRESRAPGASLACAAAPQRSSARRHGAHCGRCAAPRSNSSSMSRRSTLFGRCAHCGACTVLAPSTHLRCAACSPPAPPRTCRQRDHHDARQPA